MKRKAETTLDAPHRILSDALANASNAAAVNLPHMEHVRRTIRRQREGDDTEPVIPQHVRVAIVRVAIVHQGKISGGNCLRSGCPGIFSRYFASKIWCVVYISVLNERSFYVK